MLRDVPRTLAKIEQMFHAALERPADERLAFLDEACAGDEALRKEIDLLPSADSQKESSIEALPSVVAAGWMAKDRRKSMVGEVIGHYRITSLLGSGGMGEVISRKTLSSDAKSRSSFCHINTLKTKSACAALSRRPAPLRPFNC